MHKWHPHPSIHVNHFLVLFQSKFHIPWTDTPIHQSLQPCWILVAQLASLQHWEWLLGVGSLEKHQLGLLVWFLPPKEHKRETPGPIGKSHGTAGSVLDMIDQQLVWNESQTMWNVKQCGRLGEILGVLSFQNLVQDLEASSKHLDRSTGQIRSQLGS